MSNAAPQKTKAKWMTETWQSPAWRSAYGTDYRMLDVPGYCSWSQRALAEGESEALIAHLDATSMCLTADSLQAVTESDFEELLAELKADIE